MSESTISEEQPKEINNPDIDNAITEDDQTEKLIEKIEKLEVVNPEDQAIKEEVINGLQLLRVESYSGPLPHPSIMRGYAEISPTAVDRIFTMAEKNQQHQIDMQNRILDCQSKDTRRGMWFVYSLALFIFIGAITLICLDKTAEGFIALGGSIFTLAVPNLLNKIDKKSD